MNRTLPSSLREMKISLLLLALLLTGPVTARTQEVLRLWEGQPMPHAKPSTVVEREIEIWGGRCATNVVDPTLTIYPARGTNTGVGVVVIPGGNYQVVALAGEGYPTAKALAEVGVTAAVLKYRLPDPRTSDQPGLVPLADARRALKLLHERANRYGISSGKIGVLGFSAGSHLATVASLWKSQDADENPAFSGLIYGVTNPTKDNLKWVEERLYYRKLTAKERRQHRLLDLVSATTPPAFLAHAYDDNVCPVAESTLYAERLFRHGVAVETHLFPKGGHGFGTGRVADGTDQWLPLFANWLKRL